MLSTQIRHNGLKLEGETIVSVNDLNCKLLITVEIVLYPYHSIVSQVETIDISFLD
jgi:hypothetical protein